MNHEDANGVGININQKQIGNNAVAESIAVHTEENMKAMVLKEYANGVALDSNRKESVIKKRNIVQNNADMRAGMEDIAGKINTKDCSKKYSNILLQSQDAKFVGNGLLRRNVAEFAERRSQPKKRSNEKRRLNKKCVMFIGVINVARNFSQNMGTNIEGFVLLDVVMHLAVDRKNADAARVNGKRNTSLIDLRIGKYSSAMVGAA